MWIVFGIGAMIFAGANLFRDNKWFGFLSLSCTALTVCAFYSDAASRVASSDWSGLQDIVPTVSKILWVCVIASMVINAVAMRRWKE